MKNVLMLMFSGILLFSIVSCGSKDKKDDSKDRKKASNFAELNKAYGTKDFKDCDEIIAAGNEIFDLYFKTIDKAKVGDEKDLAELEGFETLIDNYIDKTDAFENECPDKFDELGEKITKGFEKYQDKYNELYGIDNYDEYEEDASIE